MLQSKLDKLLSFAEHQSVLPMYSTLPLLPFNVGVQFPSHSEQHSLASPNSQLSTVNVGVPPQMPIGYVAPVAPMSQVAMHSSPSVSEGNYPSSCHGFSCAPAQVFPSSPSAHDLVHSSGSSPSSPNSFAFVCPVCANPQYTPKSHCGHVRKLVDGGSGYCRMRSDVQFHADIVRHFGDVAGFVNWYTPQLRSSVGSKYVESDIVDYQQLQDSLRHCVQSRNSM